MRRLIVPSFTKINWILEILGKRQDGYHELRTVYQTIDLGEEIVFETAPGQDIRLEISGRQVAADETNLLYRAAELLRRSTGSRSGTNMRLEKKVPVGAGLGGGSSNAAMALLSLNSLWQCDLPMSELMRLAAQLGSDVPFFLMGGMALGLGRGETIYPFPDVLGHHDLVLFYPGFEISTKKAYSLRDWGVHSHSEPLTKELADTTIHRLCQVFEQGRESWFFLRNDFEDLLFESYPSLVEARNRLQKLGCERVMLCGSGSTLFGLGAIGPVKERVEANWEDQQGQFFFCSILSRQAYKQRLQEAGLILA